ncbi:MAG: membrane protein insertase YidC [Pseudomonadota bacterium]|nr:membrane protein insertase YidC [Pseudomonadota bacterium]
MDNLRTILWAIFATMVFLTWTQWESENNTITQVDLVGKDLENAAKFEQRDFDLEDKSDDSLPTILPLPDESALASRQEDPEKNLVSVSTDVLDIQISRKGGTLVSSKLKNYPLSKDVPDVPVQLLSLAEENSYVIATGLVDGSQEGPTHLTYLNTIDDNYLLEADLLEVPFSWSNEEGLKVDKVYKFFRGKYNIEIEYRIRNKSDSDWTVLNYSQISRKNNPPERSMFNVDTYSYFGGIYYDGEKYEKIDPDDLQESPIDISLKGGWVAFLQHHFLTALVPEADLDYRYEAIYKNNNLTLRTTSPAKIILSGSSDNINTSLFVGPKLQDQLKDSAPGLELTVDYGILAILASPLFWLLDKVHNYIGNWGWSIIIITLLIKLAFYKLTEASGRSMAKMRKLQPRLKSIQERYKDDRQALSQHMMDLYKREKVNPAAGCLPMLIQIPFFIAFYWVLLESVEMRQAPFALWINDLSSRDPFFVLPLLMGAAMFIQQKLNPAPPDPVQAKVMSILPIMFTFFFAFFPAGLVLYWLTNSVLSILQQWNINRRLGAE